jgi:hypothetical protein
LTLPVRIPQSEDALIKFDQPETNRVMDKIVIRDENRTRTVSHDVVNGIWRLDDFSDEGERKLLVNGIRHGSTNKNTFTIRENEPLSACVECEWELNVGRDDWQTKLKSYSKMTSDARSFYLINTITAYENAREIFNKTWRRKIKRDYV